MINTRSSFYYIEESIDTINLWLDFDEGSGEISAQVDPGSYTPTDLASAVEDALNDSLGVNTYTVTFNRTDRTFTISSTVAFDLLITSGTHAGTDVFSILGFTGADLTGASTYTGAEAVTEYRPQFYLQDYVDQEDLRKSVQATVNKSASGIIEVVKFGTEKFFEFNIRMITDIDQGVHTWVENNATGVSDARLFMRFITDKKDLEFIPDRSDPATFYKILLESTEESKDGTGYRLKELYAQGLVGYYETGKLVFRLIEE